jgi:MFS family permease
MIEGRGSSGWGVVAAAAVIICVGHGALMSLGVFLKPIEASAQWSRSGISGVAALNWVAAGLGSFVWGVLSDRYGGRRVALAGGALLGLSLVLAGQATALWHLYLWFGFGVGFAVGAFYAPLTSTATRWFTANRGLAVGIVSSGIGLGVLTVSPLARAIIDVFGWRTAMVVLGDLAWLVVIPLSLLIREAPEREGAAAAGAASGAPAFTTGGVFRSPTFWVLSITHFTCCAAHSGPILHMVSYVTDKGVVPMAAAAMFGISGLTSIVGRIGGGFVADRIGAKPTLIGGLVFQATVILLYLPAASAPAFYALALAFGLAYGGVMPLYALVARLCFGEKVMGAAYGGIFLISCVGMGLGSLAGGFVYDRLGSYAWLYAGSFAIALMAVVLAVTLRAPRPAALRLEASSPAA